MAALKSKKIQYLNNQSKIITKLICRLTHLLLTKKCPNQPKFTKRKYKLRKANKELKTCYVKTTYSKMISQPINILKTTCSASLINHHLKVTTLTESLIEIFSICVTYFSYKLVESSDAEHGSRRKNSKFLYFSHKADDNKSICFSEK